MSNKITKDFTNYLKSCFDYDSEEGVLSWKQDRPLTHFNTLKGYSIWKTKFAGRRAGTIQSPKGKRNSYISIWVNYQGKNYSLKAHRIILAIIKEKYGDFLCDHKDGNGLNNRLENLILSNNLSNSRNQRKRKTNKSGITGVSFNKRSNKWFIQIQETKEKRFFDHTKDFFEACCIAKSKYNEFGYSKRHGNE